MCPTSWTATHPTLSPIRIPTAHMHSSNNIQSHMCPPTPSCSVGFTCMCLSPPPLAGITYLTSSRVSGVDVATKSLTTAAGEVISWSTALVIATGAEVRGRLQGAGKASRCREGRDTHTGALYVCKLLGRFQKPKPCAS